MIPIEYCTPLPCSGYPLDCSSYGIFLNIIFYQYWYITILLIFFIYYYIFNYILIGEKK